MKRRAPLIKLDVSPEDAASLDRHMAAADIVHRLEVQAMAEDGLRKWLETSDDPAAAAVRDAFARAARRGRPPVMGGAKVVAGHVPEVLRKAFAARCKADGITVAEGLRQAIAAWLG